MLPSKGYFKGVNCPDQSKGGCQRPYCHYRHEARPETISTVQHISDSVNKKTDVISTSSNILKSKNADDESASSSSTDLISTVQHISDSVNKKTDVISTSSNILKSKNADDESVSSSSTDLVSSSSAIESISSNDTESQLENQGGTMAIQPELIQQLVNAAVQKVIAENPDLASGPVDTAAIMQSIDTSAIVAQATQSMSHLRTSTEQSGKEEDIESTNTDSVLKTKRKFYLRPPNAPAYNPTPIKELEKRKNVMEEGDNFSPTLTSVRNRLLDDLIENESNSKGSGVESEVTDFSTTSEDEEDKEKTKSEFDLLEEVLAEHSANNKTKVKKKKKKALGKLQYSTSPTKYVDESSLISDAREICENEFSIDIDKTPKRNINQQEEKEKIDQSEPTPYFLPPSPVFTGSSCDGYNNFGTDYTDPYSSNNTYNERDSRSSEKELTINCENDDINETMTLNNKDNSDCTTIENEKLPVSGKSSVQSKVAEPRKGHALLCQLVQNPIPVTKLSRQNVNAWIPGGAKSTSGPESNLGNGDLLEAMVSSFDEGVSQVLVSSKDIAEHSSSKDNDLMPTKLVESKTYKVDLNKEIQNLNSPIESNILTEGGKENVHKDVEDGRNDEIKHNENKNKNTKAICKENKAQELTKESIAEKNKKECSDFSDSGSDIENDENKRTDKKIRSDENKDKKGKHKKTRKKKKHRSRSNSETDEESDASSGKEKKKHKKKKKRSNKMSDSEEGNSEGEVIDRDHEKKRRKKKKKRKSYETDESEVNTDEEKTDKKHKSKSTEGGKDKMIKEKDTKSYSESERDVTDDKLDEESDVSSGKGKKKHKKKKKRSRKKSDSAENSNKESSDKDQDKKKRKQRKNRKSFDTDESEFDTDKENTDKKHKSKNVEGKKDKDKRIKEKESKSHSESEKEDINKDKLEKKNKSNKGQEKISERKSRPRERKSGDSHDNDEKDKDKTNVKEKKKRKRSSSSERSSSRHRSSSRKRKKKKRGNKHKKKHGRKHKKRKYSKSDAEESDDDDDSDEEEKSEESDEDSESCDEKESNAKEKSKKHKTSKRHKKTSRNKNKSKNKSRSSSDSSSRSRSRSRSNSKNRDKKSKDRKESKSKAERKTSPEISIPMPVDPSKIKEEKIDIVDLTKVKIEKDDDKHKHLNRDNMKNNSKNIQLPCNKTIKTEDVENEKESCKQKQTNKNSIVNDNDKFNQTKSKEEANPITNRKLVEKEEISSTDKEISKSVDARRTSDDTLKEKDKSNEKSYSKSKINDRSESDKSKERVVKENKSSSNVHKVDLNKEIEKLKSKSSNTNKDNKDRRKSVDERRDSGDRSKEKDNEKNYSKSKYNERSESSNRKERVVKENESSSSDIHKVDLEKEIEKLDGKSSIPDNITSNIVLSNKSLQESVNPVPAMSIFDMVLASTAASPIKKTLKDVSIFDAVVDNNEELPSPSSSPNQSPGHLPDSPSFDYNSKFTDPPGTFNFDGIKRRKSSSDEKDTSREKGKDKNVRLKDKKESNKKEEYNKETKIAKKEHSKDKHSTDKERENKSKDDHHKLHKSSSSSSSHRSNKESKHSSSKSSSSSTSKHKESSSSSSRSSSHSKKKDESKNHSSNSKCKSEKESDGKINRHSSSSSHSNKKHSSSSSSSKTSSSSTSNKKKNSSTSSSSKRKELLFEDLLNQPNKKLKTEKIKSQSEVGFSKNVDSDDGGDSPMPDLSALDDIEDDDWNHIINSDKPHSSHDYSHLENLRSDDSEEDELADLDDPRVMEECKQMFDDFKPPPEGMIHQSIPKERKVSKGTLDAQLPSSKQRIARASNSGNISGNLIQRPIHRKPKMTPTQMMMERYKKLKEKAEELNKLVKTQEEQLKKQQNKNAPSDSCTKIESKPIALSAAILNKPIAGKTRIARVPNVAGLLQARDKIKSIPTPSSHSLLSSQASKASGSVSAHTTAMTNSKGLKRIAHTPALESLARPIVPVEYGSKVPQNVRQRYLNTFIDECLKFCDGQAEAFSKAMAEERVCFNRATSRSIYLNLAVNTIKRLRIKQISEDAQELLLNDPQYSQDCFENQPSTSSGVSSKSLLSHPPSHKPNPMSSPTNPNLRSQSHFTTLASGGSKGSWSIEKVRRTNSEVEKLKGLALYKHLKKYILSEEDLDANGYPRPDPEEKGKAVIKVLDKRKKISPSSTERHCDRCNTLYVVDKWGFPTSSKQCSHHWGRMYKRRAPGGLTAMYSCCSGDMTSEGCNIASTHVSINFLPKELRGYVRTLPKNSKNGDFGIYALDCEMCYTTAGNELTRLTIIDAEDNLVYDTLIKPDNPIIDYNTRFSGITEEDMEDVTTTIREVQTSCLTRFSDKTILIGHSLESDLHALKIIHDTVVDTSVVFPHKMGPPYKRALRNLASEFLKRIIQEDVSGHDSKEDAAAAMDLMHWKVREDLKTNK